MIINTKRKKGEKLKIEQKKGKGKRKRLNEKRLNLPAILSSFVIGVVLGNELVDAAQGQAFFRRTSNCLGDESSIGKRGFHISLQLVVYTIFV